ncbi:serine/threonine protein kinase [Prosthecobacter sp.]|uniref:serine/threonine protein kinase n=1 Tax=Prosthecobacter sp. TaxID=1965333 RepID=UPI0037848AAF
MPQLQAGQRLFNRRYELLRALGAGGMGVVWLARDHTEELDVALKFLPSVLVLQEGEMKRLREEVRAVKELRHPRLVATYGMEVENGVAAIVMEYVPGQTLKEKLETQERGFFEPEEISAWVKDMTDGLKYLHEEARRIHRDLKPANVMIGTDERAKLMDFGISHRIKEGVSKHSKTNESAAGSSSSTLAYASPQQITGKPSHKADDIYSLGATLYELLTGTPPFFRGDAHVVGFQIATQPVTPIMERRQELVDEGLNAGVGGQVAARIEQTVTNCLGKERDVRPAGDEVAQGFRSLVYSGVSEAIKQVTRSTESTSAVDVAGAYAPAASTVAGRTTVPQPKPEQGPASARPSIPSPPPARQPADVRPSAQLKRTPRPRWREQIILLAAVFISVPLVIWSVLPKSPQPVSENPSQKGESPHQESQNPPQKEPAGQAPSGNPQQRKFLPYCFTGKEIYPSAIISTATLDLISDGKDENAMEPRLPIYGDENGWLGIEMEGVKKGAQVSVKITADKFIKLSTWQGPLEILGSDGGALIRPKILWNYEELSKIRQQQPINIIFSASVDGDALQEVTATFTLKSLNDCPLWVINENGKDAVDLSVLLAAYVNENHPEVQHILKEAMASGLVSMFDGYQSGDPSQVKRQVLAVWAALQRLGFKFSKMVDTSPDDRVIFQNVRFISESISRQANCLDGTILMASVLEKIGIHSYIVRVPGHYLLAFDLSKNSAAMPTSLETTDLGLNKLTGSKKIEFLSDNEQSKEMIPSVNSFIEAEINGDKTFQSAVRQLMQKNPTYSLISIKEARLKGIQPLSFTTEK